MMRLSTPVPPSSPVDHQHVRNERASGERRQIAGTGWLPEVLRGKPAKAEHDAAAA
jgi:hypothetical protein